MNTYKYIARIVLQAETPLFVGSGENSLTTDALVQRDYLGLPMIPATSLMGVLRHSLEDFSTEKEIWNNIFGYHKDKDNSLGGRLRLSSAYLVLDENHRIAEKISDDISEGLKQKLENLPIRQHVKITEKGVADTSKNALFDNEVMYKGSRFLFEMELSGTENDKNQWEVLLNQLESPFFRIGQGTRNGYGKLSVKYIGTKTFNLDNDLEGYVNYNSSLNASNDIKLQEKEDKPSKNQEFINYTLYLKPDDFFMFSKGSGDKDVDNMPTTEEKMAYSDNGIEFKSKTIIPATSVKGAIAHRTQFYYNKNNKNFIDEKKDVFDFGKAVDTLFGVEAGNKEGKEPKRGIVIFDDIFIDAKTKIFNHVAIDRFTGGAMNGALFNEKVAYFDKTDNVKEYKVGEKTEKFEYNLELKISVLQEKDFFDKEENEHILSSFEDTLKDICKGLLPLGGMTTKGNGFFSGVLERNGEIIYYPKTEK